MPKIRFIREHAIYNKLSLTFAVHELDETGQRTGHWVTVVPEAIIMHANGQSLDEMLRTLEDHMVKNISAAAGTLARGLTQAKLEATAQLVVDQHPNIPTYSLVDVFRTVYQEAYQTAWPQFICEVYTEEEGCGEFVHTSGALFSLLSF